MTNEEFKNLFPTTCYSLDSMLLTLKSSTLYGVNFQCTKDAISLNCIKQITNVVTSFNTNQFALVVCSTSVTDGITAVPQRAKFTDLNGVIQGIFPLSNYDGVLGSNFTIIGSATIAIFDLY